ncbi:hypothetical protein, partial [Paraburkholderia caledonica]|uniref:hypothetical protein n=1 Tax=Paraburkholderia caledonica TaxID=134536 RepID=UPI001C4FF71D
LRTSPCIRSLMPVSGSVQKVRHDTPAIDGERACRDVEFAGSGIRRDIDCLFRSGVADPAIIPQFDFHFNQGVFQKRIPFYLFFRWRLDRVLAPACYQLVKTIKRWWDRVERGR